MSTETYVTSVGEFDIYRIADELSNCRPFFQWIADRVSVGRGTREGRLALRRSHTIRVRPPLGRSMAILLICDGL